VLLEKARTRRWQWSERRRRVRFYGGLARRDGLCFDIGANVGDRTALFLDIPARVVAVEPQSLCLAVLEERYASHPRVTLVGAAVGAEPGTGEIRQTASGSVYASMSPRWIERVRASGRFAAFDWDGTEEVEVTTLDALIAAHGVPDFCKIDVEGYEREVLAGLSAPLPSLSFEFAAEYLDSTADCLARLRELGDYEFNYSPGESLALARPGWCPGGELMRALEALGGDIRVFGDVYARLRRS
jgi:FkbM family methyltransferase